MALSASGDEVSAGELLLRAAAAVPASGYLVAAWLFLVVFLYNFLEFHFVGDLLRGFRGDPVTLTFHPASEIYEGVVSRCRILHGRYLATPWLASPHIQTTFLNFLGRPPLVPYRRQIYSVRDGGTIALDWLLAADVAGGSPDMARVISKDDTTPIVVVVPGLTSDSASAYIKHLAYVMAKQGWNVVVTNHRGLAGISITSDCFYNAGWTEDVREIANYLQQEYPKAHLFVVGTSIGANILVKYLGEEGENTPFAGAASICSPWDLVVCDRFISRKLIQRLYDKALAIGLKGYAQLHQPVMSRLGNWEGIKKSRSVRDFDNHATRLLGKYETVDTYYRYCSSTNFIGNVAVPLLCISALDDPVCTREAIPWDECRANKNIVLATTTHGGHLAYFQGLTGRGLWWVKAVREFLSVLHSSPFMHIQKVETHDLHSSLESSIDKGPYVNVMNDGMIAPMTSRMGNAEELDDNKMNHEAELENQDADTNLTEEVIENGRQLVSEPDDSSRHESRGESYSKAMEELTAPIKRSINQISRRHRWSIGMLVYVAIVTTWPLLGSWISLVFRRKLRGAQSTTQGRR